MTRTSIANSLKPSFIADYNSMILGVGGQISWADVPDSYKDGVTGKKSLPAGTLVAVIPSGGTAGKLAPWDATAIDGVVTKFELLATRAAEDDQNAALSGYGTIVGGVVYENLLPDASGSPRALTSDQKTALVAVGQFVFVTRTESRG
jgi:hypothetical protein